MFLKLSQKATLLFFLQNEKNGNGLNREKKGYWTGKAI
jgi:hypothetical protein